MKKIVLIKDKNKLYTVFQPILERLGYNVELFDIWQEGNPDLLFEMKMDALIWRAKHTPVIRDLAKKVFYFMHTYKQIPTYPAWHEFWHYDDKIAQHFLFNHLDIKTPATRVFYNLQKALEFIEHAEFPIIYKAPFGAGSSNVGILKNRRKAAKYIKAVFKHGVNTFFKSDFQKGYVYLQEFLPDNDGDFRLVCFGKDEISGFFRLNRDKEVLASGSGKFVVDRIPVDLLNFIHEVHGKLKSRIMSYDVLKDCNNNWVVTEISSVFGDLTNSIYNEMMHYKKQGNGEWKEFSPKYNHFERMIHEILTSWGWSDTSK